MPAETTPVPQIASAHNSRRTFENFAYFVGGGAIVATIYLYLAGAVIPPPKPCLPSADDCAKVVDWGATICKRLVDGWPLILSAAGTLATWTGITLTRGHMDIRETNNSQDQQNTGEN